MSDILCPNCGMPNPDDQSVCSFCRQPLHASDNGESIRPGDMPTKKITADLEPVLPQWLKDARQKARQAAEEAATEQAQSAAAQPASQQPEAPNWLAGLEATAREEDQEEIPEWMRGPAAPREAAPAKQEKVEETFPRRQEIRWEEEPPEEIPETTKPPEEPVSDSGLPTWLKEMGKESAGGKEDEISSWLSEKESPPAEEDAVSPFTSGTFRPGTGELANWLDNLSAESAAQTPPAPEAGKPGSESLPDWLANLPRGESPAEPTAEESAKPMTGSFGWLKEESEKPFTPLQKSQMPAEETPAESFGADLDLPDWMKPSAEPSALQPESDHLSAWMKAQEEPSAPTQSGETGLPDWLSAQMESPAAPQPEPESPKAETPIAPAFLPGAEPMEKSDVENLFSIEMPDWLSKIEPAEPKAGPAKGAEPKSEDIAPAELPSWVQAMRPVETVLPGIEAAAASVASQPLEERGPLAGLRGVLSALPGFTPSSKPKPIPNRLQPTQDQQSHASLLEQMLTAETQAKPIRSGATTVRAHRALRWALTVVLLALIVVNLFNANPLVPLPSILPEESKPIPGILDALPVDAPALLIFDYEPALAGEMEAAAAPILDLAVSLRHPRFTVLSTSPTGAALAERFLARYKYQRGRDYLSLGYLPGESAGILAFAQNPKNTLPLSVEGAPAWDTPAAQGVNAFSDYAIVVLLTDRAENARAWVEQTAGHRSGRPFVVISSAQAAPMILPYLASGQVNGMVGGLRGGAAFAKEGDFNSDARRFWDAYNLAALVAAALIVIGGLWNWIAGLLARARGLDEI